MLLLLKSKRTHARLGTLISLSRIERSSQITTIFELAQGFTHPVHIDKCSEAQFKFGVHSGCKKTWPTGTTDYQSALETNKKRIRPFYYWGRGHGKRGVGGRVSGGAISLTMREVKRNQKSVTSPDPSLLRLGS